MNVVYYLDYFPKLSQSFILNEIHELERRGHDVVVCSLNEPDKRITHEEFDRIDVPVHYVESPTYSDGVELLSPRTLRPRVLRNTLYRASPQHHAANLFRAKRCIEFVESLDWDPDHVHSHFASVSKFGGKHVSDYYGVPFTVTTHAFDLYKEPVGEYVGSLLRGADRVVTISRYNRDHIRDRFTRETPVDVVRAGIRPGKFSPTGSTVPDRLLTISRFTEKKGLPYAIEAVGTVVEERPDVEYHIVGSGEMKSELVRKVERLGLEENVEFLDNVDDQRLVTELDEAACFLLPCVIAESNDRDGIPVALMEAMAMETPPVSTTVSGIPELVDHERNGLLTEPRNADATADALLRVLRDDSLRAEYSRRAREKVVEEFNIENEAEKLEASFRSAHTG